MCTLGDTKGDTLEQQYRIALKLSTNSECHVCPVITSYQSNCYKEKSVDQLPYYVPFVTQGETLNTSPFIEVCLPKQNKNEKRT